MGFKMKETSLEKAKSILPAPFDWCEVPSGKVTLINRGLDKKYLYLKKDEPKSFDVPTFYMAKYPITNAQYQIFVMGEGYKNKAYWTEEGWNWKGERVIPNDDLDADFLLPNCPRVNVSWYEAVAFCRWFSAVTNENIMLPSHQQWQRAAQGNDGRLFAWGNNFDGTKCNYATKPYHNNCTSDVTKYSGLGDSPFAVVDMTGNVWEWCRTSYSTGEESLVGDDIRVLCGGSWGDWHPSSLQCSTHCGGIPNDGLDDRGFRCVLSKASHV
jgi:formylglycine-generating enzyme required for sulfatase activity